MAKPALLGSEGARTWFVAVVLFALALALRLPGVDVMLPQLPEPDGVKFVAQLEAVRTGNPEVEPTVNLRSYPTLVPRAAALIDRELAPLGPTQTLEEHLDRAAHDYRVLRIAGSVLAALLAPLVFLLALRFLEFPFALLAGLLAASSALHLWLSMQARPHAAAASCVAFAMLAAIELREKNRVRDYVVAGAALGLAVGALQSGVAVATAFLAALLLRDASGRRHKLAMIAIGLVPLACVLAFLYPFNFIPAPAAEGEDLSLNEQGVLNLGGHQIQTTGFDGGGFARMAREMALYEPWIGALAVLALVVFVIVAVRRGLGAAHTRGRDVVVLLAHALPYLLAIGLYRRSYQRFLLPLLPHLCLLVAWSAQELVTRLSRVRPSRVLATSALVVLALPQLVLALGIARARLADDTTTRVARWVSAHVAPSARIAFTPAMELPLAYTQTAIDANNEWMDSPWRPWFRYQKSRGAANLPEPHFELVQMPLGTDESRRAAADDPAGFVSALGAEYAVIEVFSDRSFPLLGRVRAACREHGALVLRVGAEGDDEAANEDLPLYYQDDEYRRTRAWTWRALVTGRFGPTFEVYRLKR